MSLEKVLVTGEVVLRVRTTGLDIPPGHIKVKLLDRSGPVPTAAWKLMTKEAYAQAQPRFVRKT